ncbi:MAG: sugar transferase [Omnitrophica bacterium]|nr:sugar transferase [Candidatus Omnitrophota bacterium]
MLRESRKLIDKVNITASGVIIFLSFGFYHWAINAISPRLAPFSTYHGSIGIFIFVVIASLFMQGFSVSKRFAHPAGIIRALFICYLFGVLGFAFFAYVFKTTHLSRLYLLGGMVFSYLVVSLFFSALSSLNKELRSRGFNFQNVLLVGNKYTMPQFIETVKNNKALGLNIIGVMSIEEFGSEEFMGYKYLGNVSRIRNVLNSKAVDFVVFTVYRQGPKAVEKAMLACQERGIDTWFKPDFMQKMVLPRVDYLEDIPLFIFSLGSKNEFALMIKRLIDIMVSLAILIVMALPMLAIAALVKKTSKGPALFVQKRMGLNGRRFFVFKFRTMHTDAKQRKFERTLKNEMKGPAFKMKNDPRITRLGWFLRKYYLDELPQLWNVLIGNMSLVGPRPPLPTEVSLYKGWHRRRLSMRPGITCIWQVSGGNRICDFDDWAKLDLKYIDTWNLLSDFVILLKTIPTVYKGNGC